MAVQAIGRCLKGEGPRVSKEEFVNVLQRAFVTLESAGPRRVGVGPKRPPVLLFTDGACEPGPGGITHGAFLFDPESSRSFFFGDIVPRVWVNAWQAKGKAQVIGQAELVPLLVSKTTWIHLMSGRRILWFCDNESARMAVIRGYSPQTDSSELLITT